MSSFFSRTACRWQVVSVSSDEEDSSVQGGKDPKRSTSNWHLGKLGVKIPIGTFQLEVATFQIRSSKRFRSYILGPGILPHEAAFNSYRLSYSSDGNRAERLGTSVRTTSYSPEAGCLSFHVFPVGSGDRRQQTTLGGAITNAKISDELVRFQGRVHRALETRQGEQGGAASPRAALLLFRTVLRSPLRDFSSRVSDPISQGALDALEHTVRSCGEKVSFRSPAPESGFNFLQGDVKNSLPCLPLPRS